MAEPLVWATHWAKLCTYHLIPFNLPKTWRGTMIVPTLQMKKQLIEAESLKVKKYELVRRDKYTSAGLQFA